MTTLERLRDKANSLPQSPGVYLMKNADDTVIYVGKSKKLKNRVSSYFVLTKHTPKTERMIGQVRDFDYIVCDTEIEALTLENVLIKKHAPKYNIKLKDAKSYPYIKVTNEEYPRLYVTRERHGDRARYYGPYPSVAQAYTALETVMKIFALPSCKRRFPADIGKGRPCIYYEIGRCRGVCRGDISAADYQRAVSAAKNVLDGNIRDTVTALTEQMQEYAEALRFEEAGALRDSIRALLGLLQKQKVVADTKLDRDVFAIYTSETEGTLAMLTVRGGALISKNEFILSASELTCGEDALSLLVDYYDKQDNIPKEVTLGFSLPEEELSLLSEYLSLRAERKVTVRTPERGEARALCALALENAKEAARQHRLEGEREDKSLRRLSELLGLGFLPRRIEAYDISNIGNEHITASMVVYQDGGLKKSDYRIFSVKTTEGADDYASMREVLRRRLSHIGDGSASLGEQPDLILLDGGEAHVAVGREVLQEYSLDLSLYGMVKDDFHKTRAITDGKSEISIAQELNVYAFIYKIQEEAHRFAVKASGGAKRKTLRHSSLEKIEGIGPAKARALLRAMTLSEIKEADTEALSAVPRITEQDAKRIYDYFHKER